MNPRDRGDLPPLARLEGNPNMADVTIRVRDHGPFLVEGPVTVIDADGNAYPIDAAKPAFALCRCGHSANRPFCDGAHKSCGFQAAERAPAQGE
jgi:CDGSH-type Zn-finger protein